MTLQNIIIDRKDLTIAGVKFSDIATLNSVADALASQMFEGFNPTPQQISIIRDYLCGEIALSDVFDYAKGKPYGRLSIS